MLFHTPGYWLTCGHCGLNIGVVVVDDTDLVSVEDARSGEWVIQPVQGYKGKRDPHQLEVGDVVGHGPGSERWRIEKIEGSEVVIRLLANDTETGMPLELNHRVTVPLSVLRYTPD